MKKKRLLVATSPLLIVLTVALACTAFCGQSNDGSKDSDIPLALDETNHDDDIPEQVLCADDSEDCSETSDEDEVSDGKKNAVSVRSFQPGDEIPEEFVTRDNVDSFFTVSEIPDSIFTFMYGKSYKQDATIPRGALRYIRCLHRDINGKIFVGEMVLNITIADKVLEIFRKLYEKRYPIEKMRLVDNWNAIDELSMRANNSSSFNFRFISHTTKVSKHGLGLAVDLNPLYNPYFSPRKSGMLVEPETGRPYLDREAKFPYKIVKGDLCYRLFIEAGFKWGGDWGRSKDYQHFEK